MNLYFLALLGLSVTYHFSLFAQEGVSPEERKAVWSQTPRGLASPTQTTAASGTTTATGTGAASGTSTASVTTPNPTYDLKAFNSQIEQSTKSFNESISKMGEPNYLAEMEKARQQLSVQPSTGTIGSPEYKSICDAIVALIEQSALLQKQYYAIKASAELTVQMKKNQNKEAEKENPTAPQVAPLAAALGTTSSPSPTTLRTKISEQPGHARGLFPTYLESLSLKAYNPPK